MIKVAALTSGRMTPSSRFRVRQHIPLLQELGIRVREFTPALAKNRRIPGWPTLIPEKYALPLYAGWQALKLSTRIPGFWGSWRAQITWLERELLPTYLTLEPCLKRPLVFDVDDAIWLSHRRSETVMRKIALRADVVMAGNAFIADWFSQYAHLVHIIHTAIDTDRFRPTSRGNRQDFVVGWTGSASTLKYLEEIEEALARFAVHHADVQFVVIADRPPALSRISARFIPWTPEVEVSAVQEMSVGLMPLPDNDWARGKCAFKMLQYMACGIPSIVSPVGLNADILSMDNVGLAASRTDEWYEALSYLYHHRDEVGRYGRAARTLAERRFSARAIAKQIAGVFQRFM